MGVDGLSYLRKIRSKCRSWDSNPDSLVLQPTGLKEMPIGARQVFWAWRGLRGHCPGSVVREASPHHPERKCGSSPKGTWGRKSTWEGEVRLLSFKGMGLVGLGSPEQANSAVPRAGRGRRWGQRAGANIYMDNEQHKLCSLLQEGLA